MEEIFKKIVEQLNSSVVVLLGILLASYWFVYYVTRLAARFSVHEHKLHKVDELSEKLVEMRTKVDLIYQNTNPRKLVDSFSPIAVNEHGRKIAAKIGAEGLFNKYAGVLISLVDEAAAKNAYDIQSASMKVAKEKMMPLLDANEINTLKQEAFERGLLVEDIMAIFGVYLRDRVLAKRGIAVSEVDKHTPPAAA